MKSNIQLSVYVLWEKTEISRERTLRRNKSLSPSILRNINLPLLNKHYYVNYRVETCSEIKKSGNLYPSPLSQKKTPKRSVDEREEWRKLGPVISRYWEFFLPLKSGIFVNSRKTQLFHGNIVIWINKNILNESTSIGHEGEELFYANKFNWSHKLDKILRKKFSD